MLYTSLGPLRIKNSRYRGEDKPIDPNCPCLVCARYSLAYLRHLFVSGEILSRVLNTFHNLHFYLETMRRLRKEIELGRLESFVRSFRERYTSGC